MEQSSASSDSIPIYILNPELTLTDFKEQIELQTGKLLKYLDEAHKIVLNIIFR
jgi:hypothetical protein